jgi:hypothetical protein
VLGLLGALGASTGCTRPEQIDQLQLDSYTLDYFVLIALTAGEQPTRTSTTFGYSGGMITFGGRPELTATGSDKELLLVGFTKAELARDHRGFDPTRERELAVTLDVPPAAPELVQLPSGQFTLRSALPADSLVLKATGGRAGGGLAPDPGSMVLGALTLSLPLDPEPCRDPAKDVLRPFGAVGQLLPPSTPIPGEQTTPPDPGDPWRELEWVARPDPDRVIALAFNMLYLVQRGEPIDLGAAATFDAARPSLIIPLLGLPLGARGSATDMVLDPQPLRDGSRRLLVLQSLSGRAFVSEFRVEPPGGGLLWVRSSTVAMLAMTKDKALAIAIDPASGATLVVGDEGLIAAQTSSAARFVAQPGPIDLGGTTLGLVLATGDPSSPHLIGADDGRLFLGDALRGRWDPAFRGASASTIHYTGGALAPDGELWAASTGGVLYRRPRGGDWTDVDLSVPPRAYACAGPSHSLGGKIFGVAVTAADAFVTPEKCSALIRIPRGDPTCRAAVVRGQDPIADSSLDNEGLDFSPPYLTVGGAAGALYELELP